MLLAAFQVIGTLAVIGWAVAITISCVIFWIERD